MIVIESVNYIGITVSDLERGVNFYKDLFDFDTVDNISTAGQAFLKMGDIMLALEEVEGYKAVDDMGASVSFYVDEEDFDDAVDELKESDIEIVSGPENLRKGQRVVFLDPDGNRIELSYPRID
jgi:metallothiol transferase